MATLSPLPSSTILPNSAKLPPSKLCKLYKWEASYYRFPKDIFVGGGVQNGMWTSCSIKCRSKRIVRVTTVCHRSLTLVPNLLPTSAILPPQLCPKLPLQRLYLQAPSRLPTETVPSGLATGTVPSPPHRLPTAASGTDHAAEPRHGESGLPVGFWHSTQMHQSPAYLKDYVAQGYSELRGGGVLCICFALLCCSVLSLCSVQGS